MHGRRWQRLLCGHPHAAKDDDDYGEDEEHTACHVDEDVGVVVLLLWAHGFKWSRSQTGDVSQNRISYTGIYVLFLTEEHQKYFLLIVKNKYGFAQ